MKPSIFTMIIRGEVPCHKVYEDDRIIAFMDIHPIQPGHVLVVPKLQIDQFQDLPEVDYTALWSVVKKIANKQKQVLKRSRVGIHVVGVDIPHAHVHVFPFDTMEEYRTKVDKSIPPNHEELSAIAKKLSV
jgi:histidine triad (HIT) family protein